MGGILEYKCPNCSASIAFDSHEQKMKCPYCGTLVEVGQQEDFQEFEEEKTHRHEGEPSSWAEKDMPRWGEGEEVVLRTYSCKSCGGEITGDNTTAATNCPFCGNFVVMSEQVSKDLKPDFIIPFKLSKEDAIAAWRNNIKGRKLLPRIFKDQKHIDEIKGIYVPFWLFSGEGHGTAEFRAEDSRIWSDHYYEYTETKIYQVQRKGNVAFTHVPVDGSTKMDDNLMESIEPFDQKDAVPFQTQYLSGYFANRYDVGVDASKDRAYHRASQSVVQALEDTVTGYDMVTTVNSDVKITEGQVKYALYPVWVLNTRWKDKVYTFAMNAQTGKLVGDLPMDKGAYWRWFAILTFIIGLIIYGLMWLILYL